MRRIIATSFAIALALAAAVAHAQQVKTYGTWTVDTSDPEVQLASTVNSAGISTGVLCIQSARSCDAYIDLDMECKHGASYPMMVNSAVGSFHLSTKCVHIGKAQLFIAENRRSMMNVFENGGEIGFAVPLESDQFQVIRFSTTGAAAAIRVVLESVLANKPKTDSSRGADEIL